MFWLKLLRATWTGLIPRKLTQSPASHRSQPKQERIALLVITQDDSLRQSMHALGDIYQWEVISASAREEAISILRQRQIPLVICDEEADEDWRKTVRTIAFLPQSTCILLASRDCTDRLLREMRKHHGYDVIAKPVHFQQVADRVSFAWEWYKSGCASWRGPPPSSTLVPPSSENDG